MEHETQLVIRELTRADEEQAVAARDQLLADDFDFLPTWSPREPWEGYVQRMRAGRRGEAVPDGWVRSALFVGVRGDRLLGRVSVRYELNEWLRITGGHIGYAVIPAARRQGVAAELCRFALGELHAAGVDRALIVCDERNLASAATIRSCGGSLDETEPRVTDAHGQTVLRFWVPTRVE